MKTRLIKFLLDLGIWTAATPIAFWLRLDSQFIYYKQSILLFLAIAIPIKVATIWQLGLHKMIWHKVGVRDLLDLGKGILIVTILLAGCAIVGQHYFGLRLPRSIALIEAMVALLIMSGTRLFVRLLNEQRQQSTTKSARVLIIGAGEAGTMIAREMARHPEAGLQPIAFLDDASRLQKQKIIGLPIAGKISALATVAKAKQIDEIIIAMPSAAGEKIREIVRLAQQTRLKYRIMPGIYDLLSGKVSVSQLREVEVADLLQRDPIHLNLESIAMYVKGQIVLVTGAGGSIGSELVRQLLPFQPKKLLLLSRGEYSLYQLDQELQRTHPGLEYQLIIADVRDRNKLDHIFRSQQPTVVFHAAAHKHVPLMELNPDAAITNNVGGTKNLLDLALIYGVSHFVNVSTDKAVNPTSVMGASKRVAEYLVQMAAQQAKPGQVFVSVRFGNVLGSRGSVIPLFKKQIEAGGPITITHPDMQRYFMTIPEASQLIIQAGGLSENGRVYVLDMGEPVKIVDLAKDLIQLSGLEPNQDIHISFTGIRPGEKLYEELLTAEEGVEASRHQKIWVAKKQGLNETIFNKQLDDLFAAANEHHSARIKNVLQSIIPTFKPKED